MQKTEQPLQNGCAQDFRFDAFGNQLDTGGVGDGGVHNPFRFRGLGYYDDHTGFHYLRNRFYDPTVGRFINEDPIRWGLNWYCYAMQNPLMFIDPLGLSPSSYDEMMQSRWEQSLNLRPIQGPGGIFGTADEAAIDWGRYYFGVTTLTDAEVSSMIFSFSLDGRTFFTYTEAIMGNRRDTRIANPAHWGRPALPDGATNATAVALVHTHPSTQTVNQGDAIWADGWRLDIYTVDPVSEGIRITKYAHGSAAAAGFTLTRGIFQNTNGAHLVIGIGTRTRIREIGIHEQFYWAQLSMRYTRYRHTYTELYPHPSIVEFVRRYNLLTNQFNISRPGASFTNYNDMVQWVQAPLDGR